MDKPIENKFSVRHSELIHQGLFEIEIKSKHINDTESSILTEQIVSLNPTELVFNVNEIKGKLQPYDVLVKLLDKNLFHIGVKVFNKKGVVIGEFTLCDVTIVNFDLCNLEFDYTSSEIIQPVRININTKTVKYNSKIIETK